MKNVDAGDGRKRTRGGAATDEGKLSNGRTVISDRPDGSSWRSIKTSDSGGPWSESKRGGPVAGSACWRCGRPPRQQGIRDVIAHGERLGIPLDVPQAREWLARYAPAERARFALTRLAGAEITRRSTTNGHAVMAPVLSESHLALARASWVDGPGLVAWLAENRIVVASKYRSYITKWRNGTLAVADIEVVDVLLTSAPGQWHISDLPPELLRDQLHRGRATATEEAAA